MEAVDEDRVLSYEGASVEIIVPLIMTALQFCCITDEFRIERFRLSDTFVEEMLRFVGDTAVKGSLKFCGVELEDLSDGGFQHLVLFAFSSVGRLSLGRSSDLKAMHVNDALLDACIKMGIPKIELPNFRPMACEFYPISEQAICAFLFYESSSDTIRQLTVAHIPIDSGFCKRLISVSEFFTEDQSLSLISRQTCNAVIEIKQSSL